MFIIVAIMYVDTATSTRNGKTYTRHLLRTSYRDKGKVKHKTVANLSTCSGGEIAAIKLALKHKDNLAALAPIEEIETTLGKRIGAVWLLRVLAERLGIAQALGADSQGKLALLQVIARVIDAGSRLSAVRFAIRHAVCEIMGINRLDEDDLYENLAWLDEHQESIERKLFALRFPESVPTLFLYDVTSSYLEGVCNELADWGYNRDGKKAKMQIVVGLLAAPDGSPVAVRVFKGNTQDTQTVSEQVRILAESFGIKEVALVGDRDMLKGPQIDALPEEFRYVTAITKPQIQKMLNDKVLQYELFSERVCEVEQDGVRYVLRRNPIRAEQIAKNRKNKFASLQKLVSERTQYLLHHPKARVDVALRKIKAKAERLKAQGWVEISVHDRTFHAEENEAALAEVSLLDGCYVVKSNVPQEHADAQTLHDRYCDLEKVERAFRTMKTVHLEMRPIYVRKGTSTRAHALVVMLALLLQRELEQCWVDLDLTVKEGIDELAAIHIEEIRFGNATCQNIPTPNDLGSQLLDAAKVQLPHVLPMRQARVHTKKSLVSERNGS